MRHDPDVLVVGGGVAGLFCALQLSRRGGSVAVLERGPVGGPQSSSYGNTGFVGTHGAGALAEPGMLALGLRGLADRQAAVVIRPRLEADMLRWLWQFRRACNDADARASLSVLVSLKQRSLIMLRELCDGDGPAGGGLAAAFAEPGMLVVFGTERAFGAAQRGVPDAVARGIPLRVLSAAELAELEPDAGFEVCGALYNEEGALLRVPEFVTALGDRLAGAGVDVCPGTEVTGFDVAAGRVSGVRTSRGTFRPGEVVIAAGAWSARCARMLGIRLMLQPVKGYSLTVKAPASAPRRPVLLAEGRVAVSPSGDQLRFGGVLEISGLGGRDSAARFAGLRRTVQAYLPSMERTPVTQSWTGLRPCAPDSLPFLGRAAPYRNVLVAAGGGQMGMGLAPACGELIAQLVAGQRPEMDLTPLRVDRFGSAADGVMSGVTR
jgi:D-amino-acid dehydrogenase